MKYLLSLLIFLMSDTLHADKVDPLVTFSPKELVGILDKGKMQEADRIYEKSIMKNINLLFLKKNLMHSRYGAKKIHEEGNLIILEGSPWIRNGDSLIETLSGEQAVLRIHKKTMRIVYVKGAFISSFLLK